MLSAAAQAFNRSQKTTADLTALWNQDPLSAAKWVSDVATRTGLKVDGLDQLQALIARGDGFDAEALKALPAQKPQLLSISLDGMGALQAARADTIGWTAGNAPKAPLITGTVRAVQNGWQSIPTLETPFGTFQIANAQGTMGGTDMAAFNGGTVTVRGWPSANGTLTVEEFSPGGSGDFASGRLTTDPKTGEAVILSGPNKLVHFETPEQAALYQSLAKPAPYGGGGLLVSGKVVEEKGADGSITYRLKGARPDLYLLDGYLSDAGTHLNGEAAHGTTIPVIADKGLLQQPGASLRHYLYGHAADATELAAAGLPAGTFAFVAKAITQTCGGFMGVGTEPETPDPAQLVRTTLIGGEELPGANAPFAPAGL